MARSAETFVVASLLSATCAVLLGCGADAEGDGVSTDDANEIVSQSSSFDHVTYAYDLRVDGIVLPADQLALLGPCSASVVIEERSPFEHVRQAAGDGAHGRASVETKTETHAAVSGKLELPRYERAIAGYFTIECSSRSVEVRSKIVHFAMSLPKTIGSSPVTTAVKADAFTFDGEAYGAGARMITRDTSVNLSIREESTVAAKVVASNCEGAGADSRVYARAYTDVTKEWISENGLISHGSNWRSGNDWVATIDIDEGKLVHDFHPSAKEAGVALVELCRPKQAANDAVVVKLSLREKDVFVDDEYKPSTYELARGERRRSNFVNQRMQFANGQPVGLPIAFQVEVQ